MPAQEEPKTRHQFGAVVREAKRHGVARAARLAKDVSDKFVELRPWIGVVSKRLEPFFETLKRIDQNLAVRVSLSASEIGFR